MSKVIGLIPLYDDDKDSIWMVPGYMNVIEECGGVPIILPLTTDINILEKSYSMCDGILLTGGHDVNPNLYNEEIIKECGTTNDTRDFMEKYLFEKAVEDDKPVLGICRGIQLMNVLLGGTLYQDLPTQKKEEVDHHMSAPYDRIAHEVFVLPDTLLANIIGEGEYGVNSYHHQAIKQLASGADAMAVSEDGIIEAIRVKNRRFMVGVQWHPEFSYKTDEKCKQLVQAFVDECREH